MATKKKQLSRGEKVIAFVETYVMNPEGDHIGKPMTLLPFQRKFILETADFLYVTYGIGNDQDKHTITMLADQMDLYIECNRRIITDGIIAEYNDGKTMGPAPAVAIREKTLAKIILLMNELGLTPRSRLSSGKVSENTQVAKFLRGPKG